MATCPCYKPIHPARHPLFCLSADGRNDAVFFSVQSLYCSRNQNPSYGDVVMTVSDLTIGKNKRAAPPLHSLNNLADPETDQEAQAIAKEYRSLVRKFWFAAAISIPVMLVAYPEVPWLYLPNLFVQETSENLIRWLYVVSGIATLPVMAYSGRQFFTGAWADLKRHSADM